MSRPGNLTPAEAEACHQLTDQVLDLVAGVPAGIAVEAALRAVVIIGISIVDDRRGFDDMIASWPESMRKYADSCWTDIREQLAESVAPRPMN